MFIEAVPEPAARDAVWTAGERLRAEPSMPAEAVRWVQRDAIHLTLRFLGEVEASRLDAVSDALATLEQSGGFDLQISELGVFGGRRPRVVWAGLAEDDGFARLQRLRGQLDEALAEAGFAREAAAFRPHLTLGRVRRQASRPGAAAIGAAIRTAAAAAPRLAIAATVTQAALVESTLLPSGPRYRRLASAAL